MERLFKERILVRRGCALGAAVLVGAIGIGLAMLNRFAGGDGDDGGLDRPAEGPGPIEEGAKAPAETRAENPSPADSTGAVPVDISMTKAELYEVASEMGIKGRSSMNKAELLEAIRAAS